jgi:hypothetical protein
VPSDNRAPGNSILRCDIKFTRLGCILKVNRAKNNQFRSHVHQVVIPYLPHSRIWPVTALTRFLGRSSTLAPDVPLFTLPGNAYLTAKDFRKRLTRVLKTLNLETECYNTYSLRRGGATWLLSCGAPIAVVKAAGDWASNAVFQYLKPTPDMVFDVLCRAGASISQ